MGIEYTFENPRQVALSEISSLAEQVWIRVEGIPTTPTSKNGIRFTLENKLFCIMYGPFANEDLACADILGNKDTQTPITLTGEYDPRSLAMTVRKMTTYLGLYQTSSAGNGLTYQRPG
jgi:hypothetical protein